MWEALCRKIMVFGGKYGQLGEIWLVFTCNDVKVTGNVTCLLGKNTFFPALNMNEMNLLGFVPCLL